VGVGAASHSDPTIQDRLLAEHHVCGNGRCVGQYLAVGQAGQFDPFLVKMTPDFQVVFVADLKAAIATVARAIAVDSSGNVYITGSTTASILPSTPDAIQLRNGSCQNDFFINSCPSDAFLIKADGSNGNILYATYLGGRNSDAGTALVLGPDGSVYLGGTTNSPDFPVTAGALMTTLPAAPAGFLTHISPTHRPTARQCSLQRIGMVPHRP
jgi:hypothetical protein